MNRRRFLTLTAAAMTLPGVAHARTRWSGIALGAQAEITLTGPRPEAERALDAVRAELARLEALFSLYQPTSELTRLNARGHLPRASAEMAELLTLCDALHHLTGGRFDPTVQPLWRALAEGGAVATAERLVGWDRVRLTGAEIRLGAGQSLTLNGIAQGYVTDRIAALLRHAGFRDQLVSIGETRGDGGPWTVAVHDPNHGEVARRTLRNAAIATSSPGALPLGTRTHIFDPRGQDAPRWSTVSVEAANAALADGLSTALCLADAKTARTIATAMPDVHRITLVDAHGDLISIT